MLVGDRLRGLRPRRALPADHAEGRGAGAGGPGRGRRPDDRGRPREELDTPLMSATSAARRLRPGGASPFAWASACAWARPLILWAAERLEPRAPAGDSSRPGEPLRGPDRGDHPPAPPATACCATTPEGVHRIIENIGAQEGIARVRIFDKEGRDPDVLRARRRRARSWTSRPCSASPATPARSPAGLDRADRMRIFRAADGEPHPRRHRADPQRAELHGLPRAPRHAARARRPRRAAVDGQRGRRSWPRSAR